MRPRSLLFVGLAVVTIGGFTLPNLADAAQQRPRAAPVRKVAPRPLDLSVRGPSVAMQAAQAAQSAALPGAAQAGAAQAVEAPTSAPASTVSGLTVSPEVQRQGKVIASTEATSLTSPNFSAADAAKKPLAVAIAPNTALGRQVVDNTPPAASGGLIKNNPELLGSQPTRGEVGVTTVF